MRSRQRVSANPQTFYVYDKDGEIYQTVNKECVSYREQMTDVVNSYKAYNPVTHTVDTLGKTGSGFTVYGPAGDLWFTHESWFGQDIGSFHLTPAIPVNFIAEGISAIKPKFKSDFSLPNFIWELRELVTLGSSIRSALDFVRKQLRGKRKTDLLDVISDVHLESSFGINPLVGDIMKLLSSYKEFQSSFANFKKHAYKPVSSHYRKTFNIEPYNMRRQDNGSWDSVVHEQVGPITATLTLEYIYQPLVDIRVPDWVTYLNFIGFRANALPAIIWNASPYSFVIDWVYKVGNFLEQFDDGAIPVRMTILNGGVSLKYESEVNHRLEGRSPIRLSPEPSFSYSRKAYSRVDLSPLWLNSLQGMFSLPSFDNLSVREVSLGLALLNKLRK